MSLRNRMARLFTGTPAEWSIGEGAFAEWLRLSGLTGGSITEAKAAGLSAFYRGAALISGTIAGLPLKVYQKTPEGRVEVEHFLSSNPAGPFDLSPFSWTEMLVLHLFFHGEGFLSHIHNEGGELIGLWPVHPLAIGKVEWNGASKVFTVTLKGGSTKDYTTADMTAVLGMSTDGLRGMSPLTLFRSTINTGLAAETASNRAFTKGAMIAGLVTTAVDEDVTEDEAKVIKASLSLNMQGPENAGDVAFINRHLNFTPWTMTNADAQFIESRIFQVEEMARITGVPPHLLMSTTKVTSWGSGIVEQDLALSKYTLRSYTSRIEAAVQAVLPDDMYAEFEYKGLLAGTPKDEIETLARQVETGLLTKDEARAILNRPPLPPTPPEAQP